MKQKIDAPDMRNPSRFRFTLLHHTGLFVALTPAPGLACAGDVDLLLGDVHLKDGDGQLADQRQRLQGRQVAAVGAVHPPLPVVALRESAVLLPLRVADVGVLHLQPAGDHPLDQQPLDGRRAGPASGASPVHRGRSGSSLRRVSMWWTWYSLISSGWGPATAAAPGRASLAERPNSAAAAAGCSSQATIVHPGNPDFSLPRPF